MDLDHAVYALRDKGFRPTPQRLIVLSIVAEGSGHMGVDEVYQAVGHE